MIMGDKTISRQVSIKDGEDVEFDVIRVATTLHRDGESIDANGIEVYWNELSDELTTAAIRALFESAMSNKKHREMTIGALKSMERDLMAKLGITRDQLPRFS